VICTAYSDYSWDKIIGRLGHSDRLLILKKPFDNVEVEQLARSLTRKWFLARKAEAKVSQLEEMVRARTQEIEAAQQELQQILSAATPLCVIDTDYNMQVLNDTFCALFGLSIDEANDKKCYELMRTSKCHTPECPLRTIQNDPDVYQFEVSREDEQGEETVCLATGTPYFKPENPLETNNSHEYFKNSCFPQAEGLMVDLPVGTYMISASRGPEYTLDQKVVEVLKNSELELVFKIDKVVDTEDLISVDSHMHTLNSDGSMTIAERIKSVAAEGVDVAISTDHNTLSDYAPVLNKD